jgi:hypothetical protein
MHRLAKPIAGAVTRIVSEVLAGISFLKENAAITVKGGVT